jgi:hypothetical protein
MGTDGWERVATKFEQKLLSALPPNWDSHDHDWIEAIKDLTRQMGNQLTWLSVLNSPNLTDRLGELLRHYGADRLVKPEEGQVPNVAPDPSRLYQPDDPALYTCLDDIIAIHLDRLKRGPYG